MSLSIASIVSVVIFLVVAYSSWRNGLYSTIVTLFVIVLSASVAFLCLGPMPKMMGVSRLGWYAPPACLLGVFLLSLVVLQTLANYLYPPRVTLPKAADGIGGAAVGIVSALFLTGFLMIGFALLPGTGGAEDKVVFFGADAFVARTMSWMSACAGSTRLDADEFLRRARKEKYAYFVRERDYSEIDRENLVCFGNLHRLGQALKAYTTAYGNAYPPKIEDLLDYFPGRGRTQWKEEQIQEMMNCPATKMPYRLFPVKDYNQVVGDRRYVLIYDAVGGEAGHLGRGAGKRAAVFGDLKVDWILEPDFRALLKVQRETLTAP